MGAHMRLFKLICLAASLISTPASAQYLPPAYPAPQFPPPVLPAPQYLPPVYPAPQFPPPVMPYPAPQMGPAPMMLPPIAGARLPPNMVLQCAQQAAATGNVDFFAQCTGSRIVLPAAQQELVQCTELSTDVQGFAACSGALVLGRTLNTTQQATFQCAVRSQGDLDDFADCMGNRFIGQRLNRDQTIALDCARQSQDMDDFAMCAGSRLLGPRLSRDQRVAIKCAADSQGEFSGFAMCEANALLNNQLNPEQQIAVQCVAQTDGQPYAAAVCIASRLTLRELEKCVRDGFGGHGCFGDTNDLFGRNGWTTRTIGNAWHDLRYGPGPTNDLFGGQGFAGRTLETIRRTAPPPLQLGTVGGHRVCVPWC